MHFSSSFSLEGHLLWSNITYNLSWNFNLTSRTPENSQKCGILTNEKWMKYFFVISSKVSIFHQILPNYPTHNRAHHTTTCPQIHICIVHCIAGVGHGLSSHRGGHCPLPACSPSPGSGLRATPPRNIKSGAWPRWVRTLLGIHTQINSATNLLVRNKGIKIPGNQYKGNLFNLVMSWIEYLYKI